MKRRFLILVSVFLFASSGIMAASKPCKQCWAKLKAKGIKTLKVKLVTKNNTMKVQMQGIQKGLELAGINEKVTILLQIGDKQLGSLGSYSPSVKDDGQHGDGKVQFISMPTLKILRVSSKMFDVFKPNWKVRPRTPGAKAWKVKPARVATPAARPNRPKSPGTQAWKVRPARPARVAYPKSATPPFALLTFKNSMGQVMVYLQVQIRQF